MLTDPAVRAIAAAACILLLATIAGLLAETITETTETRDPTPPWGHAAAPGAPATAGAAPLSHLPESRSPAEQGRGLGREKPETFIGDRINV